MPDDAGIMAASPVIYGKHPAFGDFLAHGLEHATFLKLDAWLEGVLPPLKADLGDEWEAAWRVAPALNMWLGPDILGAPLMGVLLASRDRVGRRYPLVFGLTGVITPPPLHPAHDESPYRALLAHINGLDIPAKGPQGAETLLQGFSAPELRGTVFEEGQDGVLWGSRADGDLARLFGDARGADADKAQLSRSHWWHEALPGREAGWLAANGLPDMMGLRWLLTDRLSPQPEPEEASADASEPPEEAVVEGADGEEAADNE